MKAEAAHVHKTHSTLTTLAAQQAMGYTYGVVREALRMTYAVGAVPKQAKEAPLTKPENAAELPQGCPFQVRLSDVLSADTTTYQSLSAKQSQS